MRSLIALALVAIGQPAGAEDKYGPQQGGPGLSIAGTAFSADDIAGAIQSEERYSGAPNILITFTERGRLKFARVQRGRLNRPLDIRIDGALVSSPILREIVTGNQVTITGGFSLGEAAAWAARIAPQGWLGR